MAQSNTSPKWQPPDVTGDEPTHDGKYTVDRWWKVYVRSTPIINKPQLFGQFVKSGDMVFDIGANRGGMTYVFRGIGARVVAVEPLHQIAPDKVKEFHYMFRDDDYVRLIPLAVAPTPHVDLTMPDIGGQHWIVTSASKRWVQKSAHKHLYAKKTITKRVQAVTIDDLIDRYGVPDFIKIDVEGFDGEVVSTLSHPVRALNMEFHRDWLWNNGMGMRHLDTLGEYEYNYALDNQGNLALDEWLGADDLLQYLSRTLTKRGKGSWGDIYARLRG